MEKFFFNRTKYDIIAEILKKLRLPTGRTSIMLCCNMNSITSGQYLNFMRSNDLVRIDGTAGKVTYQRTEAGREFLEAYNNMILLIDPSISPPFLV